MASTSPESRSHLSLVPNPADPAATTAPVPSRRHPRRGTLAVYTLRVELQDIEPAIWRQIAVPSDLMLDALHPVLQTVMGWRDSHLHGFLSGELGSPDSERFEVRSEFSEPLGFGPPGYAAQAYEDEVRLDEVLAEVGDTLLYSYDFGDGWVHTVTLEGVDEVASSTVPVCLDGARACPPEDCGGVPGYENLLRVQASSGDASSRELREWLMMTTGKLFYKPEEFDADAVSALLRAQVEGAALMPDAATPLGALLARLSPRRVPGLFAWLPRAGLSEGAELTAEETERATRHLRWLLRVVGPDGVALTGAGYLAPKIVTEARAEFEWTQRWRGTSNRESDHPQMLHLREAAQELGLVRKAKGKLLRTKLGSTLADDQTGLLRHVAARLPLGKPKIDQEAGLIFLLGMAADRPSGESQAVLAQAIAELGWRFEGVPGALPDHETRWVIERTLGYLNAIDALSEPDARMGDETVPEWGRKLARLALR
ncbi:plasmid pRiA4b ORF-3 family protein [Tomitella biformata]|uniref:plasmid pRiA4b ORF-3 family protein n=1 Tax=Tomitella biformata TaxID=630403 RepID=UPI000467E4CC|nr:plasmid pRiA4b ORF-3 family protein [Tomitella biformata]